MEEKIAIIYAHRDRDIERINLSFKSLHNQSLKNFEVVFVDYGSDPKLVNDLKKLSEKYAFVTTYYLPVSQLLWNKSKALNYGILQTDASYIFVADVDIIFHKDAVASLTSLQSRRKFFLFKMSYLSKNASFRLLQKENFNNLEVDREGEVNGMVLASRESFLKIKGFDEFFHFYGAEDVDLFCRLEMAGYIRENIKEKLFYHIWHKSFQGADDFTLTKTPRIRNIMRINHTHYYRNKELERIEPPGQFKMGYIIEKSKSEKLQYPTRQYKINNISAEVEHFLKEELKNLKGEIVKANFMLAPYYGTLKYKIKSLTGRQTQPYLSMKEINDMILKTILFNYRDENYSFRINSDLMSIEFIVEL